MKLGWRIWLLIVVLLLSLLAIKPTFETGAVVKSVDKNSEFFTQGLRAGEIVKTVNGEGIKDKGSYTTVMDGIVIKPDGTKIEISTDKSSYVVLANVTPDITVDNIPRTKIQTGLDLRGGARALVKPDVQINDKELDELIQVSRNRFNVYGLSDVNIKGVSDLQGNKFMLIEVAGATPSDLKQLVAQQGKFEAKIGNKTVFEGGKKDIADVCRNDAKCSGIRACSPVQDGYSCEFMFTIYLTEESAARHAEMTGNISVDATGRYLAEKLYLFVDDQEVDSLLISVDLKGQKTTEISIQGPGTGKTEEEAVKDAKQNMNKLQTILITGSLPYKLNIEKLDSISPTLGQQFTNLILLAGVSAIVLVGIIVFIRYRKFKASLALLFTSFSEIIIILGFAAMVGWNLDLPSIAGILATIGTGVDQQIVILDEARKKVAAGLKEKMKRALFIIVSAYFTGLVAMLPLFWAGGGIVQGICIYYDCRDNCWSFNI